MSCVSQAKIDIPIGELYAETFEWLDANGDPIILTGWSGTAQVRAKKSESSPLLAELDVSIGLDHAITVSLPASETETLPPGTYYWQLNLTEDAIPTNEVRAIEGQAKASPGVIYS